MICIGGQQSSIEDANRETHVSIQSSPDLHLVLLRIELGVAAKMAADDEASKQLVLDRIHGVFHNA